MAGALKGLSRPGALASAVRTWVRFQLMGRLPFDGTKLNPAARDIAGRAFSDPAIAQAWARDCAAIGELYPPGRLVGGVNPGDRRALHALIMHLKPERVLEIGTHVGASTLHIARALQAVSPSASLTTVDICDVNHARTGAWRENGLALSPRDYAARLGCLDRITFEVAHSVAFMRRARPGFDVIFLDGDHEAPTVYREISAALALLPAGGIILLHDYFPDGRPLVADGERISGPYRAVRRIARECPEIGVHPLGVLPWPAKHGSCATTLALITRADPHGCPH